MSESYISAIETKGYRLTEEVAYRCYRAFGLPLNCLREKPPELGVSRSKCLRVLKPYPTVGKKLERLRVLILKITQKELGKYLGIGAQEISRLENDRKTFSNRNCHRLTYLTGLPHGYFRQPPDFSTWKQRQNSAA